MALSLRTCYLFGMLILSGVLASLLTKALYSESAPGWGGEVSSFEKPFSTTFFMFKNISLNHFSKNLLSIILSYTKGEIILSPHFPATIFVLLYFCLERD